MIRSQREDVKAYHKAYNHNKYVTNPQFRKAKREEADKREERNRTYVREVRKASVCAICGESRWQVLEFHHRDPSTKLFNASDGSNRSLNTIQAEIDKCDVLCSNCHAMVEWEKRNLV